MYSFACSLILYSKTIVQTPKLPDSQTPKQQASKSSPYFKSVMSEKSWSP